MSNYLEGVFRPAYSFDTISGFQVSLDTSLNGNVTIGNSNTNYSLLLNGNPITGNVVGSNRVYTEYVAGGKSEESYVGVHGEFGYSAAYPWSNLYTFSNAQLTNIIQNNNTITVNMMTNAKTVDPDYCLTRWAMDANGNSNISNASIQSCLITRANPDIFSEIPVLTPISLTFTLVKGVHYDNNTQFLRLNATNNSASSNVAWNTWTWSFNGTGYSYTNDFIVNFIGST